VTQTIHANQIILFNKPFQVLCQFTGKEGKETLANYIDVPEVYAAGRLDYDSEGLLILTNNGRLQNHIAHPRSKMGKTYAAQVEPQVTEDALAQLRRGVEIKGGRTRPAAARMLTEPTWLWERQPPIRYRAHIPTSWLELTITEGRNRQVRRMTAAVGFPTLRLIRTHIGPWHIGRLQPGEWEVVTVSDEVMKRVR
jgi:23S rRNA pseudouridine2457 synthase